MNQPNNTEIDLLMRRHARRGGEVREKPGGAQRDSRARDASSHLDADELNAYAENAIPQATRARYTAHLADCADCRKLVAELSLAANVPLKEEGAVAVEKSTRRSLGQWLAAIFAAPALRYAALALVAVAVAATALIVLRQQRGDTSLVARNERQAQEPSSPAGVEDSSLNHEEGSGGIAQTATTANSSTANTSAATASRPANESASGNATGERRPSDEEFRANAKTSAPAQSINQPAPPAGSAAATINEQREAEAGRTESLPAVPPQSQAQAPPAASVTTNGVYAQNGRRAEEADRVDDRAARKTSSELASAAPTGTSAPAQPQDRPQTLSRRSRGESSSGAVALGGASKNGNDAGEVRSVAGHNFRKQGRTWIDTAYSSSMSTTSVSRGSEHYRSLVSDAPEIRTIADQLSGEVIVVLNGHAYRIR